MRKLDYKEQLTDYFKKNLSKGYTVDSLKFALANQGYSRVSIEQALEQANKDLAAQAPALKEKPIIRYELYDEENKKIPLEPFTLLEKVKFFFKGKRV